MVFGDYLIIRGPSHLLALKVTPANEQERAQVEGLIAEVQEVTGGSVKAAFVDQGYTGEEPAAQAAKHGVELIVVKLAEAKRGFVLLPRRWVVERSFAWASRFRRLARDYERLPSSVARLHDPHAPVSPPLKFRIRSKSFLVLLNSLVHKNARHLSEARRRKTFLTIKANPFLPRPRIRPVTVKTILSDDRPHIAVENHTLLRRDRGQ